MTYETSAVDLRGVFATFPGRGRPANALALVGGFVPAVLGFVVAATLGTPVAAAVAGILTGAFYGVLYTRAVGGPMWDLVMPGLVVAVVHSAMLAPGAGSLASWVGPLAAYSSVAAVVALWHRHLGDGHADWAAANFPEPYRVLLGGADR